MSEQISEAAWRNAASKYIRFEGENMGGRWANLPDELVLLSEARMEQAELDTDEVTDAEVTSQEASDACHRFEQLRQMGENDYEEEDMKTVLEQFIADRKAAKKARSV